MQLHGSCGRHAAQVAALDTRRAKDRAVRPEQLAPGVAPCAPPGSDCTRRESRGSSAGQTLAPTAWDAAFAELAAPTGLTQRPLDLRAPRRPPGALRSGRPGRDGAGDRARRRRVPAARRAVVRVGQRPATSSARYSTPELLELEAAHGRDRRRAARRRPGVARADAVEPALASRPFLSGEQREMVAAPHTRRRRRRRQSSGRPAPARRPRSAAAREAWGRPACPSAAARSPPAAQQLEHAPPACEPRASPRCSASVARSRPAPC